MSGLLPEILKEKLTISSSSLQRIETGLEEMRLISEEHTSEESSEATAGSANDILSATTGNPSTSDQEPEVLAPPHWATGISTSKSIDRHQRADPNVGIISRPSETVLARIEKLPRSLQQELADVFFSNCLAACHEFYHNHGLWRTKYSPDDTAQERKLFQLVDGSFPKFIHL